MTYELTAYPVRPNSADGWVIEPGGARRDWMGQTQSEAAYRCLPILIANQTGWIIRCPISFKVVWNGKRPALDSMQFEFGEGAEQAKGQILSNFGFGIVTFKMPWVFRTSEGFDLMVRGPTNYYKENVVPLDGLVESDWAPYSFTMNWKIIKPKTAIWFKKGEPICMLIPFAVATLEKFTARYDSFDNNPELLEEFLQWQSQRMDQTSQAIKAGDDSKLFRLDYVKGKHPDGTAARVHRTSLKLAEFTDASIPDPAADPA